MLSQDQINNSVILVIINNIYMHSFPHLFILLLSITIIPIACTSQFASYQFRFTLTYSTVQPGFDVYDVTASLPIAYPSNYTRAFTLSGFSMDYSTQVRIIMTAKPFTSDSNAEAEVKVATSMTMGTISVFVVLIQSNDWIWVMNQIKSFSSISISSAILSESWSIPSPTTITSTFDFTVLPFVTSFHSYIASLTDHIRTNIQFNGFTAGNIDLQTYRISGLEMLLQIRYIVVLINDVQTTSNAISKFAINYSVDNNNPLTAPVNFGITGQYNGSPYGGFAERCLIGISVFSILKSTLGTARTLLFDVYTDPFQGIIDDIPSSFTYYCEWNVLCLLECQSGTFLFANQCHGCIPNCITCSTFSTCEICNTTYGFAMYANACQLCSGLITNCLECLNDTYCTACTPAFLVDGNNTCSICSSVLDACLTCQNSSFCLSCNSSHYLTPIGTSQLCFNCSLSLPNCLTCSDSSTCASCTTPTHFLRSNDSQCYLCSIIIQFCLQCQVSPDNLVFSCSQCEFGRIYTVGRCRNCSLLIGNCSQCTNSSYCSVCISNQYAFVSSPNCQPCSTFFPGCAQCTNTECTLCSSNLVLSPTGRCACDFGTLVSGICTSIVGCTSVVFDANGGQTCLQCDSNSFNSTPVNGICQCLNGGNIVNGVCNTISGCISLITINEFSSCLFCNTSAGFNSTPNLTNQCQCQQKYHIQGQACEDICGDGFVMTSSRQCDDGNLIDGDGCSSICSVQTEYRCENGSSSSPSSCIYIGIPLKTSLSSIKRTEDKDQGIFNFFISPPILNINRMDLYQQVNLSCDASYSISEITYSSGNLKIIADYTTDMEGLNCNLTVVYDHSVIVSPTFALSFLAVSQNIELRVSQYNSLLAIIKTIFQYLSYISLGIFAISIPHKMIGAELLLCGQMAYISNSFYEKSTFLFSSVKNMRMVTAYWSLFYSSADSQLIEPFTDRVEITPFFTENNIIVIGILFFISLVFLVLKFVLIRSTSSTEKITIKSQKCSQMTSKGIKILYSFLIFPVTAGFFMILSIAVFINSLRLNQDENIFPLFLNSTFILLVLVMFGVIFSIEIFLTIPLGGEKDVKFWYIPFFLFKITFLTLLIEIGIVHSFSSVVYMILILFISCLVILIVFRPYLGIMDTIGIISCQVTNIFIVFLPILNNFANVQQYDEIFLIFVLQSLIIISSILAIIRICLVYYSWIKRQKENQKEEEEEQVVERVEKKVFLTQAMKIQKQIEKHQKKRNSSLHFVNKVPSLSKKQARYQAKKQFKNKSIHQIDQEEPDNDEELQKIKSRLKDSLINKVKKQQNRQFY